LKPYLSTGTNAEQNVETARKPSTGLKLHRPRGDALDGVVETARKPSTGLKLGLLDSVSVAVGRRDG